MKFSMEAIAVQKNAAQLIETVLSAIEEVPGGVADGDTLSSVYHDEELWQTEKWGDEANMSYYRDMVKFARYLFDWSEMIDSNNDRVTDTDIAMRNTFPQAYNQLRQERLSDLDNLLNNLETN